MHSLYKLTLLIGQGSGSVFKINDFHSKENHKKVIHQKLCWINFRQVFYKAFL